MEKTTEHYGLFTAISMIVGICVGSGIFFKADDILRYTGGNIGLSVLVFVIGVLCVIFGNITLAQLATRTQHAGGIVAYFETFVSPQSAAGFGWFQTFAYFPTITVVIAWVSGIYTTALLGIDGSLELQILIGLGYILFFYGMNYLSARLGGAFQNLATLIKIIPLLGVGLLGLFGDMTQPVVTENVLTPMSDLGWTWLAALAPMAFSYDGWVVSTSITHEVRNAQKNMPIALTFGPLIILAIYLSYFLGMVTLVGPEYILAAGDNAIYYIGDQLFGAVGGRLLLSFILIAVLGVLNGIILGYLRMPQVLAAKNMLPNSNRLKQRNSKTGLSPSAAAFSLLISLIWLIVHYLTLKTGLLGQGDVSEIAIVFSYITYAFLYVKVIHLHQKGEIKNPLFGKVFPVLGILGSTVIVVGGIASNPTYVPIFLVICAIICFLGYRFYEHKN